MMASKKRIPTSSTQLPADTLKLFWPVPGEYDVASPFGPRRLRIDNYATKVHKGIDISCPVGTDVVASHEGTIDVVIQSTRPRELAGGYGIMVAVLSPDKSVETRYAHLSSVHVADGEVVEAGQLIGMSGETGRATGPHLHYEIRIAPDGPSGPLKPIDPLEADLVTFVSQGTRRKVRVYEIDARTEEVAQTSVGAWSFENGYGSSYSSADTRMIFVTRFSTGYCMLPRHYGKVLAVAGTPEEVLEAALSSKSKGTVFCALLPEEGDSATFARFLVKCAVDLNPDRLISHRLLIIAWDSMSGDADSEHCVRENMIEYARWSPSMFKLAMLDDHGCRL